MGRFGEENSTGNRLPSEEEDIDYKKLIDEARKRFRQNPKEQAKKSLELLNNLELPPIIKQRPEYATDFYQISVEFSSFLAKCIDSKRIKDFRDYMNYDNVIAFGDVLNDSVEYQLQKDKVSLGVKTKKLAKLYADCFDTIKNLVRDTLLKTEFLTQKQATSSNIVESLSAVEQEFKINLSFLKHIFSDSEELPKLNSIRHKKYYYDYKTEKLTLINFKTLKPIGEFGWREFDWNLGRLNSIMNGLLRGIFSINKLWLEDQSLNNFDKLDELYRNFNIK